MGGQSDNPEGAPCTAGASLPGDPGAEWQLCGPCVSCSCGWGQRVGAELLSSPTQEMQQHSGLSVGVHTQQA